MLSAFLALRAELNGEDTLMWGDLPDQAAAKADFISLTFFEIGLSAGWR